MGHRSLRALIDCMKAKRNSKGSSCELTGQNYHQLARIKTFPANPGEILGLMGKIWDFDQDLSPDWPGPWVIGEAYRSGAFSMTHWIITSISTEQHQEWINLCSNLGDSYQGTGQIFCLVGEVS